MGRRPPGFRNLGFLGTLIVLGLGLFIQACTQRDVVGVITGSVVVSPSSATVMEGETQQFSAIVRDEDGDELEGAAVEWSSLDPNTATVDGAGVVTGVLRGTTTIRATRDGVSGTSQVTVQQTAGIFVSQVSGPTTEVGGQATFTIQLASEPAANVTIGISSSDETEGLVSPTSVTFTQADWDQPQTITVTGQNDDIADGNVGYAIVTSPATSADSRYDGLDADDVLVTNNDDDTPGIVVSPISGPTTEVGGLATFTVVLTSQPTAAVTIGLSSSDTSEGTVNVAALTFTSANWNVPQTVIVTGRNDPTADGNIVYSIVTAPATSADPQYNGVDAPDVSVTNIDDETAGITVSAPSRPTTEAGGQATFTMVLNAAPTADVTIDLTSSDTSEGTLSAPSLTFTSANWNVPQTVTVTGQDDDVDDDDVIYTVITAAATSADPNYQGLDAEDVVMTNIDDETAAVRVSPPSGPTTEAGGTATFTVVLASEPTADVTIALSSSDTSEGTISTGSLTFTSGNWNVPRVVTVTGVDDALADGNVLYTIVLSPATSNDQKYAGFDPPDVAMTNVDDETPGIAISAPSGPTTEAGGQATFTVVLNTEPTASVTVGLSSSDPTEGTVSLSSLVFTTSDWNAPRVVTVTGQDDDVDDGDIVYTIVTAPAVSADPNYSGLDASDVAITNVDDERAGITVSAPSGPTTEAGGTASFTIVLDSEPTANVTIAVASSDATKGVVTSPTPLLFTPANWSTAQTVTVTGQDDDIINPSLTYAIVTSPATSADPLYNGLNAADVLMTNVDDETAGITVSPVSGPTTEAGAQAIFTIVLNNRPSANVTIGISSSDLTEGTVSVSSLTFTTADWNVPQSVVVTGQDDFVDDDNVVYTIVTSPSVSTDTNYNGINAADVSITNIDDDTAGFTVTPASGPTTEGGGSATFTLRLNSQPMANVTIGLSSSDLTEGTVAPSSVTFTPSGAGIWSTSQTVTVTGQNDPVQDGNVVYTILTAPATSTDPRYNGLNAPDVSVTNVDDDVAGITVSPVSGPTTEAGGTATFTVVLDTEPSGPVTIGFSSSDPTEGVVTSPASGSLTFNPAGAGLWSTPQTVTVTGQNDFVDDGDVAYLIVTSPAISTDPQYNGVNASDVQITNTDNDQAGITVSPPTGPTTEAGGTATFTVVLTSEPTASVTIGLSSSDATEGLVSPTSLTFNPSGAGLWSTPQTVTVTGQDDAVADGNIVYSIVTAPATSSDPGYNGMNAADVSVTNIDNETAGIIVSPISGPTTETGGTATFTIVLNTQPSAPVTIALSSSDTSEGLVSPASVTFNPTAPNIWSTPQTVTVTGQNDAIADGNVVYSIVTAPATSSDAGYNGMNAADVSVTNVDDETPGITVSAISGPTTEEGGAATFTIILNSQPTANVTIALSSSDVSEGTVSPASLTFTPSGAGIWSTAQVVTVTGQDDDVDDGNIAYTIVTAAAVSSDVVYNGVNPADVSVTNVDDDVAGVSVSPPTGPTSETGDIAQFTVVLNSQPTANVSIALASNDPTEGLVTSSTPIVFTTGNWSTPQTVTVTGQNDAIDDDNVSYAVQSTASSSDPLYAGIAIASVPLTNLDDTDLARIDVTPTSGLVTSETGTTAQFSIVLNSEPISNVSILLSSSDPTEGQVTSTNPLVFTAANWNVAQVVTVTGQNDFIDDGDVPYTILTAPATSLDDMKYNGMNAADVAATNTDDADTAGIIVSPTSGLVTTEAGGQATFTIVLTSEPLAPVSIVVESGDPTEGTASPTLLTFNPTGPSAWNLPQTVTVTGFNDILDDGDQPYTIVTDAATSADPLYNGRTVDDVSVTSVDIHEAALSINDVTVNEASDAQFTVTLSVPSTQTVTVQYATSNGTAVAPDDYTAIGLTTLTFNPGVTSLPVDVVVLDDALNETTETFNVTLSNPTNATIADGTGVGTITDNDPTPTLSIDDVTMTETDASGVSANFTVTLSAASGQTVTVQYATSSGTAVAPDDYTAIALTTLTFNPGVTTQPVSVAIVGDLLDEANETFNVNLSNPTNATIADGTGVGTITDNDPTPTLSINDVTVTETDASGVSANFTVTLSAASGRTVTVQYATSNGTAVAPDDYTAIGLTTLTFNPGVTTQPVSVAIAGDLLDEANETFNVNLSNVTNATIADGTGVGTITDNDPTPTLSINDVTVTEADDAQFTVTLSAASGQTVTVQYATSNGTAVAPDDYTAIGLTTLTFNPGVTSLPVDVVVLDDALNETTETFNVTLSNPTNATIADGTGVGTITDNDPTPTLSINDVTVTETDASGVSANFTVTLSAASGQTVTVQYATSNGTAVAPDDYTAIGLTTLTFNPGVTTQPVSVAIAGDLLDEANETFNVNLANATNATIADGTGVGTITDNDPTPTLSINDVTVAEANNAQFTVTLSAASGQTVTVQYATSNGTAVAPDDYTAIGLTTLTFNPGVTSLPVDVVVLDDALNEATETFNVTLSNPSNTTIANGTGVGTITDNDPAGFTLAHLDGFTTVAEAAGPNSTDSVSVVLTAQPTEGVTIVLTSDDPDEFNFDEIGNDPSSTLTFTSANWNIPQIVSLYGESDGIPDGDQDILLIAAVDANNSDDAWDSLPDQTLIVEVRDVP